MKKRVSFVFGIFLVLILMSFVSAGIFDWLKTGKATSQPQDVSLTVSGLVPQIIYVEDIDNGGVNPIFPNELDLPSPVSVVFIVTVSDDNGVDNIDDTSVSADFIFGLEPKRSGSCSWVVDNPDGISANYSCSVDMNYYTPAGTWVVTVYAEDLDTNFAVPDTSESFDYAILKAMTISPSTISFGSVATLASNIEATDDPVTITNTGNYDGAVSVQGYDLYGLTDNTEVIPVANFAVGTISGSECSATVLVNGVSQSITGSNSNPGIGGTEEIYYCLTFVPNVASQDYSTTATGGQSWIVLY